LEYAGRADSSQAAPLHQWAEWAMKEAERIDPLSAARTDPTKFNLP